MQGPLEQVAQKEALAQEDIAQRVDMQPAGVAQVFVRAARERVPRVPGRLGSQSLCGAPAKHARVLAGRQLAGGRRAARPGWLIQHLIGRPDGRPRPEYADLRADRLTPVIVIAADR
jgi:hypothetical protein